MPQTRIHVSDSVQHHAALCACFASRFKVSLLYCTESDLQPEFPHKTGSNRHISLCSLACFVLIRAAQLIIKKSWSSFIHTCILISKWWRFSCLYCSVHSHHAALTCFLFTLQKSQTLYQSQSHSVKPTRRLIQQSGQRRAKDSAVQLNQLFFSSSFMVFCCQSPLLQQPDTASAVSHVDQQEGGRSQFTWWSWSRNLHI